MLRIITSALTLLTYAQFSASTPLGPAVSGGEAALSVGENAEATCTDPHDPSLIHGALDPQLVGTFPRECKDTATDFFNTPMVARIPWHWKRIPRGESPPPGYNFLPFTAAPTSCMLTLDVLDDPNAEDQFALVQIANDFRALYNKCVYGRVRGPSAGFIPVGPRKVLKLSIRPTPEFMRSALARNSTELGALDMS
ncbi:MAG: hypothetical protein Q9225_004677 [Loekoesia sp. 1 TL-2023]